MSIVVSFTTVNPVPATPPKSAAVAPVKPIPVITTEVPPEVGPVLVLMLKIAGPNVYWSATTTGLVFPPDVTVMSTCPIACDGEVIVIDVSLLTTIPVPAVAPKSTTLAPVNPLPVNVTVVPPAFGPPLGLIPVMYGPT
jgi:hypothetical protein